MRKHTHESTTSARSLSLDDRVCWGHEFVAHVDGTDETHRFQHLLVLRDGKTHSYRKDMGLASAFPLATSGFNLVAGLPVFAGTTIAGWSEGCYSVGEVLEMFEYYRVGIDPGDPLFDLRMSGQRTLLDDWHEMRDERRQLREHRTVIGPHISVQRN